MIGPDKGQPITTLAMLTNHWMTLKKAIDYYEKYLEIALEIGDRAGEGRAYGNLGIACKSLGDTEKAIEYQEKQFKIAKEVGDLGMEGLG